MVYILKIVGKGLWLIAMVLLYLLTNAFTTIYAQEKKVTNGISSSPEIPMTLLSSPSIQPINQTSSKSVTIE